MPSDTTPTIAVATVALLVLATAAVPLAATAQQIRPGTTSGNSAEWRVSNPPSNTPFTVEGEGMSGYLVAEKQAGVNVEAIRFRLRQGTGFDLALNYRPGSDPSTPEIAGVKPLSKINVSHEGISDSEIDEAVIRFAVEKSKLEDLRVTNDDVVFYKLDGTSWEEMNVAEIQERHDEYVFETRLASLSWFAIGVRQPNFEILNPYVGVDEIGEGDEATVHVKVFNDGSTTGTLPVTVTTDGTVLARENVTLQPDESRNLEIPVSFDTIGEYAIRVNDQDAGTLRVVQAGTADPTEQGPQDGDDGDGDGSGNESDGGNGMPGFTAVVAAIAALAAAATVRR